MENVWPYTRSFLRDTNHEIDVNGLDDFFTPLGLSV